LTFNHFDDQGQAVMVGIRGRTLIINLPGSPKGAIENLEAIWAVVPHTVAKVQGDPSDRAQ